MSTTKGSTTIWIVVIIVLIVIGGIFAFKNRAEAPTDGTDTTGGLDPNDPFAEDTIGVPIDENGEPIDETQTLPPETEDEPPPPQPIGGGGPLKQHTITYTDEGYSQNVLTIKQNESVMFVNQSSGVMWPASDAHPTHTEYPDSGRAKCDTPEEEGVFDACRDIPVGGSWSFIFTEVGTWGFHDHKDPSETGTITVTANPGL